MNEQDFIDAMRGIDGDDNEKAHLQADNILLNALRELGWSRLADEYLTHKRSVRFGMLDSAHTHMLGSA